MAGVPYRTVTVTSTGSVLCSIESTALYVKTYCPAMSGVNTNPLISSPAAKSLPSGADLTVTVACKVLSTELMTVAAGSAMFLAPSTDTSVCATSIVSRYSVTCTVYVTGSAAVPKESVAVYVNT